MVLIITFMIQILLTATAYFLRFVYNGELHQYTVLDMIYMILALGFQIFDFHYNLKNIVGFIVSVAGVYMVLNFVGLPNLGIASLLALILYVFSAFMSVMGMMARYVQTKEDSSKAKTETK